MEKKTVILPRWAAIALLAAVLLLAAFAATAAVRYHALRETVLAREAAVPGFLERHSAFAKRCEDRWTNRLKSWLLLTDVCDPWR